MTDRPSHEQAVRLLRAKAAELKAQVLAESGMAEVYLRPVTALAADVALVAQLLADHIERTEASDD